METTKWKAVKLRSHLDKYLVASSDLITVRQSRDCSTRLSIWLVDHSSSTTTVRFRNSATGLYLTASESLFLLGTTGKRAVQSSVQSAAIEWEVERDAFQMRLKTKMANGEVRLLRANGGTPPWRNTVTHDVRVSSNWTLWDVEMVEEEEISPSPWISATKSGMDLFNNAKCVRLRSHHGKYLTANKNEDLVSQQSRAISNNAEWGVELSGEYVRLKSYHGKYLTASEQPFLLGMTGCKVLQTLPAYNHEDGVEWEPVAEGKHLKLRARNGNFLRANGGIPPWRNSITHDFPHRPSTRHWLLWELQVIRFLNPATPRSSHSTSLTLSSSSGRFIGGRHSRRESSEFVVFHPPRRMGGNGRAIHYQIVDEDGNLKDGNGPFNFNGNNVEELTQTLEDSTGIQDIVVCTRNPLDGRLCPLRLHLPPNTLPMQVLVLPSTSLATKIFETKGVY